MKVIFDTSIWIEYFKGNVMYFDQCQQLIENGQIIGVDVVYAELLQGALNKREVEIIKQYAAIIVAGNIPELYTKAGDYSRENKLLSKGIGLIDAIIIVSAIELDAVLWTLDRKILNFVETNYLYSAFN